MEVLGWAALVAVLIGLVVLFVRSLDNAAQGRTIEACTGMAAQWCPNHGHCICLPDNGWDPPLPRVGHACPLHAPDSTHGGDE